MILRNYRAVGGRDLVVTKTLSRLKKTFSFARLTTTRFCDWGCLRVDPSCNPVISFFSTSDEWERWWQSQLKEPDLHLYPDEEALGLKKDFVTIEMEKVISVAHEWGHLLQIDGEYGFKKREIPCDFSQTLKMRMIVESERETEDLSRRFFLDFGEEILGIDLRDYRLEKSISSQQLVFFMG